jgi:hypothetical protein
MAPPIGGGLSQEGPVLTSPGLNGLPVGTALAVRTEPF